MILTALVAVSATASAQALEPIDVVDVVPHAASTTVTIRAASGGCTNASMFDVKLAQEPARQVLTIVRTAIDVCEAFAPNGTTLALDVTGLVGSKPIVLANPLFVSTKR